MRIEDLQAKLRQFAAEREWQPFHTPKNLSTALMVEAAELAEVFQWMTPQESLEAHLNPASKQRIGEELADVLLYLLQVADHSQIDVQKAVDDKLASNAHKYPSKMTVAAIPQVEAVPPDTHILLDYENVQPTDVELRSMVPEATKVWVFHGPHQKQVEQRFTSFGTGVTRVPISKTGKNALDFHLSFYMGYIVSRNQQARIVVVANDMGYQPMLEHAKSMGFAVRQQGHGRGSQDAAKKSSAAVAAKRAVKKAAAKRGPTKKAVAKKTPAVKKTARKSAPAKEAVSKTAKQTAAKKVAKGGPPNKATVLAPAARQPKVASPSPGSPAMLQKLTDSLRKMGDKRPVKLASLRRALKPLLGTTSSEDSIELALANLIAQGIVSLGPTSGVIYPKFAPVPKA